MASPFRRAAALTVSLLTVALSSCAATNNFRVALLIGNGAYRTNPLDNAANDARTLANTLDDMGFDVYALSDADRATMVHAIEEFATRASNADITLFYYSGHGAQINERNYLVPCDFSVRHQLGEQLVSVDALLSALSGKAASNIVLLDACRNNPFATDIQRAQSRGDSILLDAADVRLGQGLAQIRIGPDFLIGFATQPGNIAWGGTGSLSTFTEGLLRHINSPGQEINFILNQVRNDVERATKGKQVPWTNSSLRHHVYLAIDDLPPPT